MLERAKSDERNESPGYSQRFVASLLATPPSSLAPHLSPTLYVSNISCGSTQGMTSVGAGLSLIMKRRRPPTFASFPLTVVKGLRQR